MTLLTGINKLDQPNQLFKTKSLIICAGRPGMGKTSLAVHLGEAIVTSNKVLYVSLEISSEHLHRKFTINKMVILDDIEITTTILREKIISGGYKLVIIDYLQLYTNNYKNEINALKQLSEELDICILVLSQLSRDLEYRIIEERRPNLQDLENNFGALHYLDYFNKVLFLYREQYYLPESNDTSIELISDETIKLYYNKLTGGLTDDLSLS